MLAFFLEVPDPLGVEGPLFFPEPEVEPEGGAGGGGAVPAQALMVSFS